MDPKEMAKLFARAAKFGIDGDKVQALIDDGKGRAELDALIVEKQTAEADELRKEVKTQSERAEKAEKAPGKQPAQIDGAPAIVTEKRGYSLLNVCKALGGERVDIGFEVEMSQELGRQRGKAPKGMLIPFNALARRDLSVSGTSSATVATLLDSSRFIEELNSNYVIGRLGVQFMPGVTGNLSLPRMTAGATAYHVAEAGDITESTPTLDNVTGTPHTIGALVDVTRRMLEQSTPAVEQFVQRNMQTKLMIGIQTAVFAGTGSDGQPSAITNATGINNPSINSAGTPTYAEILGFKSSIMDDNADSESQKFAMTGEVWAKLAATLVGTDGGRTVLDPFAKKCIGYDYEVTSGVPANSLWFGDWSQIVIPFWGNGVEIASDSAKLFASGGLTLRAMLDYDVMVLRGQALAYNAAVTS